MTPARPNKPAIPEVLPLINALYCRGSECTMGSGSVGGHLHIVLDDGNTENGDLEYCIEAARRDECTTCLEIGTKMLAMSTTQRKKLYRSHN